MHILMSLIESIVNFKTAESLAKVQMAVAAKVLNVAKDQGQMAVELVDAAVETMQETSDNLANDLGGHFDGYA